MPVAAERTLNREFLLSERQLAQPVSMLEFAPHEDAGEPLHSFSGSLRLSGTPDSSGSKLVHDYFNRSDEIGTPLLRLPEFEFQFFQRGTDIIPIQRGVQRRDHPYWEVILQPGKAWSEAGDGGWTRASLPVSLQERAANCTHNGVLTWLFNDQSVTRVAYQVSSETCGYLKIDLWGIADGEYRPQDLTTAAEPHIARLDAHRAARLPVRPLSELATDYPGVDAPGLGIKDGIRPEDLSVYGLVVNGINYRSSCATRHGPYPYCDSLPLPSYSTAKSVFAALAMMRLEKLQPGSSQQTIASLIDACGSRKWRDVTIEHALDMATGNYRSKDAEIDEYSVPHREFVFSDKHEEKLRFACNYFRRKADPGERFVYHTSDTYLVGVALRTLLREFEGRDADPYRTLLVEPIWDELELSPLLDDSKRTYDEASQAFTGYGLTLEADDLLRIASWIAHDDARLGGETMVDAPMLNAALQRDPRDQGIAAGNDRLRYNNGFWAYDAGPSIGCDSPVWVPFMSGVSGITVAMFPNGVIYYYFSDGYVFRWQSAREAAHTIRSLCE
jgi:hypothetical protein